MVGMTVTSNVRQLILCMHSAGSQGPPGVSLPGPKGSQGERGSAGPPGRDGLQGQSGESIKE